MRQSSTGQTTVTHWLPSCQKTSRNFLPGWRSLPLSGPVSRYTHSTLHCYPASSVYLRPFSRGSRFDKSEVEMWKSQQQTHDTNINLIRWLATADLNICQRGMTFQPALSMPTGCKWEAAFVYLCLESWTVFKLVSVICEMYHMAMVNLYMSHKCSCKNSMFSPYLKLFDLISETILII